MLTSLGRMTGMPVVWQDRQIGLVERAVPDARHARLDGVIVRKGIGIARWATVDDILLVGERCVVLRRKPARLPERAMGEMRRAFLTTGECAGEVTDALLEGDTLDIPALEICQGPLYRLIGQRAYAGRFYPSDHGEPGEVVIPALLTWTQLLRQLGEEDEEWEPSKQPRQE